MTHTAVRQDPAVTDALQSTLVELIDLSLRAKQAHWNVVGPNFRSVHLELDEITDLARVTSDQVAERIAALGGSPDGRAATIAGVGHGEAFPAGLLDTARVVELMTDRIDHIAAVSRTRIAALDDELVSQGILIAIVEQLEKAAWMLRAQQA
jgi:starvation-inducible DNA-binding protein